MIVSVVFKGPNFNFSKIENERTLTDTPKSSMTLEKLRFPSLQGIDKILGSLYFGGKPFCKIEEIFSPTLMVSLFFNFFFLTHNSFKNFA